MRENKTYSTYPKQYNVGVCTAGGGDVVHRLLKITKNRKVSKPL